MIEDKITWPPAGCYILAISGGADSMVLLDLMASASKNQGYELVVAHFDHGLRSNSCDDRHFVEMAAQSHKLPFEHTEARLGTASEAVARSARHEWLEQVRARRQADAVVTAHHQDDMLETSLLNLARGSGRHGLAPMPTGDILRPLIHLTREQLRGYAAVHDVGWREDPTNADISNPRNYLRHEMLPYADSAWRSRYLELLTSLGKLNTKVDQSISTILEGAQDGEMSYSFPRLILRDMSLTLLEELLIAAALKLCPDVELERRVVIEIALFAKTSAPHKHRPLRKNLLVEVQTDHVRVYYMGISKVGRR